MRTLPSCDDDQRVRPTTWYVPANDTRTNQMRRRLCSPITELCLNRSDSVGSCFDISLAQILLGDDARDHSAAPAQLAPQVHLRIVAQHESAAATGRAGDDERRVRRGAGAM